ncbi:MAG: hypothetical protein KC482_01675 [Dehalococcoidia bacterium]|nr:hypothetical protein [Dehalococcoidia bacterium]MCA9824139.1 hypothetical protein [Dehalococcoidia bacterium]MCA9844482.1 hypothetical protein [Dehalococcoidia bacterium]MCA9852305.1 hypothetical protein [Dehalococcoidia bacterium]
MAEAKRASERDKEHFRKIGRWKAESHRIALEEHLAKSPSERLVAALAMTLRGPYFPGPAAGDETERPPIYERAERLGLYRT